MASTVRHRTRSQPVAALRGRRSVRERPCRCSEAVAANGAAAEAAALSAFGRHWGTRRDVRGGAARQREPAEAARPSTPRASARHRRIPSRLSRASWPRASAPACTHRPGRRTASRAGAPSEVARAARYYMVAQVENGHMCPITMTRACGRRARRRARRCCAAADAEDRVAHATTRASGRGGRRPAITLGMGMTEKQGGTDVRANTTQRDAGRRWLSHHRAQMVHVGADVRRVPGAGAGAGRAHLLPHAALPARRQRQRAAFPAAEGQARQPLQCLVGSRIRRRLAWRVGEEGRGHAHHHRDGAAHAARLRDLLGRHDAHGAGASAASRAPSHRVPEEARRSADDAHGARRHGAGGRRRDRAGDAALPLVRSCGDAIRKKRRVRGC